MRKEGAKNHKPLVGGCSSPEKEGGSLRARDGEVGNKGGAVISTRLDPMRNSADFLNEKKGKEKELKMRVPSERANAGRPDRPERESCKSFFIPSVRLLV